MSDTYIRTYTGIAFDILDPTPDMVSIVDIVVSLSRLCRYNGHKPTDSNIVQIYSVAQHSVYVYYQSLLYDLSVRGKLKALLHDAAEAYIGDIVFPLKHYRPLYNVIRPIEKEIERCIFSKFDILEYTVDDDVIKYMDKRICESEKRIFNCNATMDMHEQYIPYKHFNKWINVDDLWNSKTAYLNMMKSYNELVGE